MDTPVGMGLVVGGEVSGVMNWMVEDSRMSEWLRCLSTVHHRLILWQEFGVGESHRCGRVSCGCAIDTREVAGNRLVDMHQFINI